MEIWSLTRFPRERARSPSPRRALECDDPRWPPIPAQDFRTCRANRAARQRFEYMRLSERAEGGISNFERTVTGSWPAFRTTSCSPRCAPSM